MQDNVQEKSAYIWFWFCEFEWHIGSLPSSESIFVVAAVSLHTKATSLTPAKIWKMQGFFAHCCPFARLYPHVHAYIHRDTQLDVWRCQWIAQSLLVNKRPPYLPLTTSLAAFVRRLAYLKAKMTGLHCQKSNAFKQLPWLNSYLPADVRIFSQPSVTNQNLPNARQSQQIPDPSSRNCRMRDSGN